MKSNTFSDGFKIGVLAQGLLIAIGLVIGVGIGVAAGGLRR
jgi:hypothetical protein